MASQISKTILLTGAGFTKNFGGFLSTEMWDRIFNSNEVRDRPNLRAILEIDFDYESVYSKVIDGDYSQDEKNAIAKAIFKAYQELDRVASEYTPVYDPSRAEILSGAQRLLREFAQDRHKINFFFTLNQDLFAERMFSETEKPLCSPGITTRIIAPGTLSSRTPLVDSGFVTIPQNIVAKSADSLSPIEFNYVKLHGSFGWKSSDGSSRMVIGKNKDRLISEEPLLSWYFDLLKQTLFQGGIKLMVIGYAFRDVHINKVIIDSITKHDLKLYIISPLTFGQFKEELSKTVDVESIRLGLQNYFHCDFASLFPPNQSITTTWQEIKRSFFG